MPDVRSNGIDIRYETTGDPANPALLLVMGLGAQLIDWPDEFCELLAGRGYYVIRYDNRDAGLSTWLDELGAPDLNAIMQGDRSGVPYLLSDMAADAAGLLKSLGIAQAYVVGASMGGMIVQQLAIDSPELVSGLCSIMSTTGDRSVGHSTPEAGAALMRPPAADRDEAIRSGVAASRVIGSTGFEITDAELERRAAAKYDRAYHPVGTLRQFAAILASPDRTEALRSVTVPALVIHGAADPLIDVSGGRATAEAIPGARLLVIDGMGHDLPRGAWAEIVDAIA